MDYAIFLAANRPGSEKAIKTICKEAKKSARPYIEDVDFRREGANDGEEIYSIRVSLFDGEDEETTDRLAKAICDRIIMTGVIKGFIPLDREGEIIYIFPPYEFAVILHTEETGQLMLLNEIVNSVCAELPNFNGSWIETPENAVQTGELFIVHIKMQDYYAPEARRLIRLACFFRLMLKVTAAGFAAIELPENDEEDEPEDANNS